MTDIETLKNKITALEQILDELGQDSLADTVWAGISHKVRTGSPHTYPDKYGIRFRQTGGEPEVIGIYGMSQGEYFPDTALTDYTFKPDPFCSTERFRRGIETRIEQQIEQRQKKLHRKKKKQN